MTDSIPLATSAKGSEGWITLTPAAQEKASEYLKKEGREVVRVSFDQSGGLGLELDKLRPGDRTFAVGELTVAVAGAAADLVKGLTVDFVGTGGEVGFKFGGTAQALDPKVGLHARELIARAAADGHSGGHTQTYMNIFYSLIVLTVLELGCTYLPVSKIAIILMLIILAFTKASLVGMYFMHLKFEGRWKHIILVPPVLLACVLIFALMPDISFSDQEKAPGGLMSGPTKEPTPGAQDGGAHK